ncbi:MAG: TetR/AcrR family transcriptional regulator [Rhizobiaceae bacterium]|nr:MAG: TetR/AcrR family transcriptional regulator [Rhizobiaceae bacterium]CAG0956014.1 putative HTH-type transcriptional regulator YfiR [Rhizobiaceae bacterium]
MDDFLLVKDSAPLAEPGEPVSRAERRDLQTQRILDAAKTCFVRHGFQGASMNQICTEAGMSPGALYRYFASKEAIIEAITDQHRRDDAELYGRMLSNPDVIDGVVETALAHVRQVHERAMAPLFAEIRAESMRNPAVERCCMLNMETIRIQFRDYLSAAEERGEIDPLVDLDTLMTALMAIGEGLALNDLLSQGVDPDKLETLVRASVIALLRPSASRAAAGSRPSAR